MLKDYEDRKQEALERAESRRLAKSATGSMKRVGSTQMSPKAVTSPVEIQLIETRANGEAKPEGGDTAAAGPGVKAAETAAETAGCCCTKDMKFDEDDDDAASDDLHDRYSWAGSPAR